MYSLYKNGYRLLNDGITTTETSTCVIDLNNKKKKQMETYIFSYWDSEASGSVVNAAMRERINPSQNIRKILKYKLHDLEI